MSKLWFKIPIILVCVLLVAFTVFFGKVAYAASGDPEFGLILTNGATAFTDYLSWLIDVLELVW